MPHALDHLNTISGPPALAYAHSHFIAEWGTHTNPNSHAPYPWEFQTNPDPFTLQTMATGRPELTVLPAILDFAAFTRSVSRLSNNKAPGPDGFPNELIKALPPSFHRALHSLFILFWLTGHAPTTWKTSETTLLHKRGDPLLFDSKRPIGLGRSVYKLYTRFVTDCLSNFADQYGIFSETQEGCLPRRSPARQLMRLTLAIEDAAWTQSDLFILHTDMSSAFNRVDHPLLLRFMTSLGFPADAIDVADLYTNTSTRVRVGTLGLTDLNRHQARHYPGR
jgi:hypothetical protein